MLTRCSQIARHGKNEGDPQVGTSPASPRRGCAALRGCPSPEPKVGTLGKPALVEELMPRALRVLQKPQGRGCNCKHLLAAPRKGLPPSCRCSQGSEPTPCPCGAQLHCQAPAPAVVPSQAHSGLSLPSGAASHPGAPIAAAVPALSCAIAPGCSQDHRAAGNPAVIPAAVHRFGALGRAVMPSAAWLTTAEQCRHPQHSSSHGSTGTADPLAPGCSPALLELGWQHQHPKLSTQRA